MSPRRSSRARTTQPPSTAQTAHSGSSSSVSSGRTDRATRADHKQTSPQKSSTPHSLSSEEPEDLAQMDRPLTRRRTREQDVDDDDPTKLDEDLDDDMIEEEDEVTRCVCGYQEYPGPPSDAAKSLEGDDLSGLFIQCDICKVWQHGGCVGIMDEAASPDEYFCEECRKDLHKVTTSPKGYVHTSTAAPSATLSHCSMLTPYTARNTPVTSPCTINSMARKPASRPSPKKHYPHQAATMTVIRDPVSIRLASADPQ